MHGENILASNDESSFGFFPFTSLTQNFESLDRRPITDSGHIGLKLRACVFLKWLKMVFILFRAFGGSFEAHICF
jgi:hypothetical protein